MSHPNHPEEVLHGITARDPGPDPSNTPVDELVETIESDDPTLHRLSDVWANPTVADDQVRDAVRLAEAPDDEASQ